MNTEYHRADVVSDTARSHGTAEQDVNALSGSGSPESGRQHSLSSSRTKSARTVSGRSIVVAMFGLGIAATAFLFLYWNLHLMPFMPLQEAIVADFPGSAPRVEGGRRKMHRRTPMLLRVVMRVPYDPTLADSVVSSENEDCVTRVRSLAEKHVGLKDYEILEVNLYHPVREKVIREKMIRRSLQSWEDVNEHGEPVKPTPSAAPQASAP